MKFIQINKNVCKINVKNFWYFSTFLEKVDNNSSISRLKSKYPVYYSPHNMVFFFTKYSQILNVLICDKIILNSLHHHIFESNKFFFLNLFLNKKKHFYFKNRINFAYLSKTIFFFNESSNNKFYFWFLINILKEQKKIIEMLRKNINLDIMRNQSISKKIIFNNFFKSKNILLGSKKFENLLIKGYLFFWCTWNNIFITILDSWGNTLMTWTGGTNNRWGTWERGNPFSSESATYECCIFAKEKGLTAVSVHAWSSLWLSQIKSAFEGLILSGLIVLDFSYWNIRAIGGCWPRKWRWV